MDDWAPDRRTMIQSLVSAPLFAVPPPRALASASHQATHTAAPQDLGSVWRLAADVEDRGLEERWFARTLADRVPLPGSLEQSRIGNLPGLDTPWTADLFDRAFFDSPEYAAYRGSKDFKFPYFLQPDHWFRGAAWYQRDIEIPEDWRGRSIELFLERAHWETHVWLDDRAYGRNEALHVPHRYRLGQLAPGRHRLTIRVDNRMIVEIGRNGHGVTDHTQGNWNGIAGRIELRANPSAWIAGVKLHPDLVTRTLTVRGRIQRAGSTMPSTVRIEAAGRVTTSPLRWAQEFAEFEARLPFDVDDANALRAWSEFDPVTHPATVTLANGATWSGRFGWRDLRGTPNGFVLNGRPMLLRGTLECAIFPHTGHPPTERAASDRIMRRVRDYGLNHLRFHSYCPPEAAFDAADAAGVYLQIETVWANQSVNIGQGLPVDRWVYAETERIIAEHGNHPSFLLMTHGNEPGGGDAAGEVRRDAFLAGYVRHFRARDPRRLWTAGSAWPLVKENQYHVTPEPRVQAWGEGLHSRINALPPETRSDYRSHVRRYTVPLVSHEIGQCCVYPRLDERHKYTGYLKAKNFDIFEDRLRASGLLALAPAFVNASGKLQLLCYKEEIESALRTPGMGGFQLLGIQDFPGQGTALVGVVDPFWDDKGYVTAEEFRRFCAPVVPLARMESRRARAGAPFRFTIDIANFGAAPLARADIVWSIRSNDGTTMASGRFAGRPVPLGNAPCDLQVSCLLDASRATAARLEVTVHEAGVQVASNDWDIWVYPQHAGASVATGTGERLRISSGIDADTLLHLEAGGDALIGLPAHRISNHAVNPVQLGFSSIFWNTAWTNRQAPTTLGILCDPAHPALAEFPTEAHSNWQWWYLLHRAGALRLDLLPPSVQPIVRIIDDWFTARPLGLVIEVRVGRGRAIVCGFEVDGPAAADAVSRQIVASMTRYMRSNAFLPKTTVTKDELLLLDASNRPTR